MQDSNTAVQDQPTTDAQPENIQAIEQELEKELSGDEGPVDPNAVAANDTGDMQDLADDLDDNDSDDDSNDNDTE